MPMLVKDDDIIKGTKASSRHGRLRVALVNNDIVARTGQKVTRGFLTGLSIHFGLLVVQVLSRMDEASQ